jgi:hypothetical protein
MSRDHHCSVPFGVAMAGLRRGSAGIPTGMMVFDIAGAPFDGARLFVTAGYFIPSASSRMDLSSDWRRQA